MEFMAIEVFKILNKTSQPVLSNLVQKMSSSYNFSYSNTLQVPTVKTSSFGYSSMRYLCYGTDFQMILENVQILINLRVLFFHGGSVVVVLLFNVLPIVCGLMCLSLFWYVLLCVISSLAIIFKRKRELAALLLLSYGCLETVNVL